MHPQDTDKKRVTGYQPDGPDTAHNDDLSASPIGRLMSDDDETTGESSAYVSGFDRTPPEETSPLAEPEPVAEPPASKTPESLDDDDFFEAGIREARAVRERRRQPNPAPRPAVRANVPTQRRMTSPPPMSQPPPEDAYDTFRQRYRPGELISSTKGGRPVRQAPPVAGGRSPMPPPRAVHDDDSINPLRYLLLGAVVVFLGVLVFLLVHSHNLRGNLAEAEATIASMQAAYDRYGNVVEANELLQAEVDAQAVIIENLEAELALRNEVGTTEPGTPSGGENNQPTTTEPPVNVAPFPRTHVIQRGQNLSSIARYHYQVAGQPPLTASEVYSLAGHIQRYNNIANQNAIQAGQTITIPAPPSN